MECKRQTWKVSNRIISYTSCRPSLILKNVLFWVMGPLWKRDTRSVFLRWRLLAIQTSLSAWVTRIVCFSISQKAQDVSYINSKKLIITFAEFKRISQSVDHPYRMVKCDTCQRHCKTVIPIQHARSGTCSPSYFSSLHISWRGRRGGLMVSVLDSLHPGV